MLKKYIPLFPKIEQNKKKYQQKLLDSSFENKFDALIRLQEKVKFFNSSYRKFSESFSMGKVIDALEDLKKHKLIEDFVLGGATALLYYSTPHLTEDIDIFIPLHNKGILIDLSPIYSFLKENYNAKEDGEFLLIGGNPIQFLVPMNALTEEAFKNAKKITLNNKHIKIFSLEYIIAIMLDLNKSKYQERLRVVKNENKYDKEILNSILKKYSLSHKWEKIKGE